MRILKIILIVVVILVAIPLITALFVKKDFSVEKDIVINRPKDEVFDYIKYVKNQDHYGVWQLSDPGMKKSYEGVDGAPGFKYAWDSKKMGKGTQTITNVTAGERLDTELDFGFGDPAKSYIITQDAGAGKTTVTWGVTGRSPYPFNIMNLFYSMDGDFEQGLQNLKAVLEKQ